ncbi:MAG: hypothetical protein WAS36_01525 [Candidatus Saccharimonadales bacterium]
MEFDKVTRHYVPEDAPEARDGDWIGIHHPVHIDNLGQVGLLIELNRSAIRVNGDNPAATAASRLAEANLGLICFHSGPMPLLRRF